MIADTLATVGRLRTASTRSSAASGIDTVDGDAPRSVSTPLLRADSAFFGYPTIGAAITGGADVSITTGLNTVIRAAISAIASDAWTPIEYTDAIYDEESQQWISAAEVAEISFTAFASQKKTHHIPGRLIVRRIPDLRPKKDQGQRHCSMSGDSTRFSPPPQSPIWAPSPRTNCTVTTRSSNKCTRI